MQSQVYKVIDLIAISIYDQEFIIYIKERVSSCLYCHGKPCIIKITLKVKIWSKAHFLELFYTGYSYLELDILSPYEFLIWFFGMSNIHYTMCYVAVQGQFNEQTGFNDCLLLFTAQYLLIVHDNSSSYICVYIKLRWWRQDGAV